MKKLLLFIFVINVKLFVFAQSNKFSNEIAWLDKNIIPITSLKAGSGFEAFLDRMAVFEIGVKRQVQQGLS